MLRSIDGSGSQEVEMGVARVDAVGRRPYSVFRARTKAAKIVIQPEVKSTEHVSQPKP